MSTLSLPAIQQTWDDQNRNLHKYFSFLSTPIPESCALLQDKLSSSLDLDFCPVIPVSQKYNLTLLEYRPGMTVPLERCFLYGSIEVPQYNIEHRRILNEIVLRNINFVTITNPASLTNGVGAFVSPFDWETWTCLLASISSVTLLLLLLEGKWTKQDTLATFISIADKFITITCIFLGQVGDSSGKPYSQLRVVIMLLILWLFGNLFLMVNYYQGSIYSFLAVLSPPRTPCGVGDMINLDSPIIAIDRYASNDGSEHTYLQDVVIPQLISSVDQNQKFLKFLTLFQAKLLSVNDISVSKMLYKTMRENTSRHCQ